MKVKMKVREVQEVLSTPKIVQRVAEPQGNQKSGPMLLPKVSLKCGLAIQVWKLNLWFRAELAPSLDVMKVMLAKAQNQCELGTSVSINYRYTVNR